MYTLRVVLAALFLGALVRIIELGENPGSQQIPPRISLDDIEWRDSSETRPRTRLLGTIQIGSVLLHLEAFLAEQREEPLGGEEQFGEVQTYEVQSFPGDFGDTAESVYEAVAADGAWQTVEIDGREYVLIATPYNR